MVRQWSSALLCRCDAPVMKNGGGVRRVFTSILRASMISEAFEALCVLAARSLLVLDCSPTPSLPAPPSKRCFHVLFLRKSTAASISHHKSEKAAVSQNVDSLPAATCCRAELRKARRSQRLSKLSFHSGMDIFYTFVLV